MLTEDQIGEYLEAGVRYPQVSAMGTGKAVERGDVVIRSGKRLVMVKASEWYALKTAQRATMRAEWQRQLSGMAAVQKATAAEVEPDLTPMTFAELKAQAEREGVDLRGRKSADEVRSAIEVHRIQARFGVTAPVEDAGETPAQEGTQS